MSTLHTTDPQTLPPKENLEGSISTGIEFELLPCEDKYPDNTDLDFGVTVGPKVPAGIYRAPSSDTSILR